MSFRSVFFFRSSDSSNDESTDDALQLELLPACGRLPPEGVANLRLRLKPHLKGLVETSLEVELFVEMEEMQEGRGEGGGGEAGGEGEGGDNVNNFVRAKDADLVVGVDVRGMAILKEKVAILNPVVDFGVFRTLDDPFVVKARHLESLECLFSC